MSYRLPISAITLAIALCLQIFLGNVSAVWTELAMATLIVSAFFLRFLELLLLILFSVAVLNWQPAWSAEILLFVLIPILAYSLRQFSPLSPFPSSVLFLTISTFSLYLIFSPRSVVNQPHLFLADLLGSLLYGMAAYWTLKMQK